MLLRKLPTLRSRARTAAPSAEEASYRMSSMADLRNFIGETLRLLRAEDA